MRFDIELFSALQEEYREKPIVPQARGLDSTSLTDAARARSASLDKRLGGIAGRRVLEVGCGRGHTSRVLKDEYGCETVGVDIKEYPDWAERSDMSFFVHDIAGLENDFLGSFDAIVSFSVWEHVEHPFSALKATREMLNPDGQMFLGANLYRGQRASHRYREVFFPWPHLLFQDDVFVDYYQNVLGRRSSGAAWVNRLTTAHYERYFELLDFNVEKLWWSPLNFDQGFYNRFKDQLGRYPVYDLERDFIYAIVSPGRSPLSVADAGPQAAAVTLQQNVLQTERELGADRDALATRLAESESTIAQLHADNADIQLKLARADARLIELENANRQLDADTADTRRKLQDANARIGQLEKLSTRLTRARDEAVQRLDAIYASRSWKVTGPLRQVKRYLR